MAYAIVMVRSGIKSAEGVRDALRFLNLTRINHCVVVPETDSYKGMLRKVKDNVTWGEVSPEVVIRLIKERGRIEGSDRNVEEYLKNKTGMDSLDNLAADIASDKLSITHINGFNPVFRLPPPSKGYEGVKRGYSRARPNKGGSLGYRGDAINLLLDRMLSNKDGVPKEKSSPKKAKAPPKKSSEEEPASSPKKSVKKKKAVGAKETKKKEE